MENISKNSLQKNLISINDIFDHLLKNYKIFVIPLIFGFIVAMTCVFNLKNYYIATFTIKINEAGLLQKLESINEPTLIIAYLKKEINQNAELKDVCFEKIPKTNYLNYVSELIKLEIPKEKDLLIRIKVKGYNSEITKNCSMYLYKLVLNYQENVKKNKINILNTNISMLIEVNNQIKNLLKNSGIDNTLKYLIISNNINNMYKVEEYKNNINQLKEISELESDIYPIKASLLKLKFLIVFIGLAGGFLLGALIILVKEFLTIHHKKRRII